MTCARFFRADRGLRGGLSWPLLLICLMLGAAGCQLASGQQENGARLTLTRHVAPSAFLAVLPGSTVSRALAALIAATARPEEDVDILHAGAQSKVLLATESPAPVRVTIPGRPTAPGAGTTSYQYATYKDHLKRWRAEEAAGRRLAAARTRAALSNWASTFSSAPRTSTVAGGEGTLAGECAAAASALAGLEQSTGDSFGSRRVILVYASNLDGLLRAGELNGDDLIVITPFLPSATAASGAQANLIDAGAIQASVLGPETTSAQLDHLVGAGLSQRVITEALSGAALFGNNSSVLRSGAVRVLEPLLVPLHRPGASAVVNGYASTTGTTRGNLRLSYARAAAVAGFLEAHGIPVAAVIVVGHGASDLVAAGPSAANRRVVVVIEEPPAGSS